MRRSLIKIRRRRPRRRCRKAAQLLTTLPPTLLGFPPCPVLRQPFLPRALLRLEPVLLRLVLAAQRLLADEQRKRQAERRDARVEDPHVLERGGDGGADDGALARGKRADVRRRRARGGGADARGDRGAEARG